MGKMITDKINIAKSYFESKWISKRIKSREDIDRYHDKKVIDLLKKTIISSPFYKELYSGLDLKDWRDFPTITKKRMDGKF